MTFLRLLSQTAVVSLAFSVGCAEGDDPAIGGGGSGGTGGSAGEVSVGGAEPTAGAAGQIQMAGASGMPEGGAQDGGAPQGGPPPQPDETPDAGPLTGISFDTDSAGFRLLRTEPPSLAGLSLVDWVNNVGVPSPGSLLMLVPFSSDGQSALVVTDLGVQQDLSQSEVRAQIRLGDGLGETAEERGYARLAVGADTAAYGSWTLLVLGEWVAIQLAPGAPEVSDEGFDASSVSWLGVEVATGSKIQNYQAATVLLDDVKWQ